ncbi:MAG: hypothetical protein K8H88_00765 [Sandaracinaceae bacterium]|nr:hypothetical protein [Sandaracinaceae bacterium]
MLEMMREAGFMAYGILCLAILTHPLAIASAIVAIASKRRGLIVGLASASALLVMVTLCLGPVGYWLGMQQVEAAVAFSASDETARLREIGQAEAMNNFWCALMGGGLPGLLSGVALVIGMLRKPA